MKQILFFISISNIFIAAACIIVYIIDKKRYKKKLSEGTYYIPFSMIPALTRTIHCCTDLSDIRYQPGDIFELNEIVEDNNGNKKTNKTYFVALEIGDIYKLPDAQIYRLEQFYNIKIKNRYT